MNLSSAVSEQATLLAGKSGLAFKLGDKTRLGVDGGCGVGIPRGGGRLQPLTSALILILIKLGWGWQKGEEGGQTKEGVFISS